MRMINDMPAVLSIHFVQGGNMGPDDIVARPLNPQDNEYIVAIDSEWFEANGQSQIKILIAHEIEHILRNWRKPE